MSTEDTLRHVSIIRCVVILVWIVRALSVPSHELAALCGLPLIAVGPVGWIVASDVVQVACVNVQLLSLLTYATCVVGVYALVSGAPRWPVWLFVVGVVLLDALHKAVAGVPYHGQVLPLLILFVIAAYPRIPFLSVTEMWRRRSRETSPCDSASECIYVCAIVVVVPYSLIGIERLVISGIDLFRSDALLEYIAFSSNQFEAALVPDHLPAYSWLLSLGFAIVTAFETASSVALVSARFRVVWLVVMGAFHCSTLPLMNVFFWENLAVLLVVFIRWDRRLSEVIGRWQK
jgi:hypothetical protein